MYVFVCSFIHSSICSFISVPLFPGALDIYAHNSLHGRTHDPHVHKGLHTHTQNLMELQARSPEGSGAGSLMGRGSQHSCRTPLLPPGVLATAGSKLSRKTSQCSCTVSPADLGGGEKSSSEEGVGRREPRKGRRTHSALVDWLGVESVWLWEVAQGGQWTPDRPHCALEVWWMANIWQSDAFQIRRCPTLTSDSGPFRKSPAPLFSPHPGTGCPHCSLRIF